jgi:hypothetical protein
VLVVGLETPTLPSVESLVSGFMLSINFSTDMTGGAGAGVLAAVLASGVFIGMPELAGRNFAGNFSAGKGSPAGMGATISGVTITINSVFALIFCID